MSKLMLFILAATSTYLPLPIDFPQQKKIVEEEVRWLSVVTPVLAAGYTSAQSINDIHLMLSNEAPSLNPLVINKVLTMLKCVATYNVDHNNILTVIDYSLPSNEKRLWVFDLKTKKLLFHTYVSHGIKSGQLISNYFSNKFNSKASSIGLYQTQQAYYGRDGLSLRLDGLDRSFNDNASNRSVVIHSGWYVEEGFIKKYGRPGRSWGCPALPLQGSNDIINTIKDKSLLVIYYPSDNWFEKSKFLNCDKSLSEQTVTTKASNGTMLTTIPPDDQRDDIFFITSGYKGNKNSESNPVAVISADDYQRIFHNIAPLTRMLRRQINSAEYIALNSSELNYLATNNLVREEGGVNLIDFVIPVMKVVRGGYYETQMQFVNLGKIKEIKPDDGARENGMVSRFTIYFEGNSSVNLNASSQFIRWVGL